MSLRTPETQNKFVEYRRNTTNFLRRWREYDVIGCGLLGTTHGLAIVSVCEGMQLWTQGRHIDSFIDAGMGVFSLALSLKVAQRMHRGLPSSGNYTR